MESNLLHAHQVVEYADAAPLYEGDRVSMDTISRSRNLAALFMVLLVAWDLAGGAFETTKRPLPVEASIFAFGVLILALIPLMRSTLRWVPLVAGVICFLHFLFAVFAIFKAPPNEGFGRPGPGIAALFLGLATYFSQKAHREST